LTNSVALRFIYFLLTTSVN